MTKRSAFLFRTSPHIMRQIESIAEMTNMTKTDFINQSISRNLLYFFSVEKKRYEATMYSRTDFDEPLQFYLEQYR